MDRILKLAKKSVDEAEVYYLRSKSIPIEFRDEKIEEIKIHEYTEVALRVIKDGKLGMSFGSPDEPDILVKSAVKSAETGSKVKFSFPEKSQIIDFENYDKEMETPPIEDIVRKILAKIKWIKKCNIKAPIMYGINIGIADITIANTKGLNVNYKRSAFKQYCMIVLPQSMMGPYVVDVNYRFREIEEKEFEGLIQKFEIAKNSVTVPTKKMRVLFSPEALWTLEWRLTEAISGKNLIEHLSPIENKINEKIFDDKITIYDDPHARGYFWSRPFDDEGVPTRRLPIIDKGILKNFIFDLRTASEYGTESTGNGYKGRWSSEAISKPVSPYPCHLVWEQGSLSVKEQIKSIDEGLICEDLLGAHSGNIVAGQFSMNVGTGFYVKDGKIIGRAIDTMISGNIYDIFKNIHSISKERNYELKPWVLFNGIQVAGKG